VTQITAAYWVQVQREIARLQPDVQRAFIGAFQKIQEGLSEKELTQFMTSGGVDRFVLQALPEDELDKAFGPVRAQIQKVSKTAAEREAKRIPAGGPSIPFDVLNPKIIASFDALDTRVLSALKDTVRETVRDTVKAGLEEGLAPKTIAKEMREVIGLAPNQAKAVRNFEKMLREKDPEVLSRALRDKRFDGTITKMFAEGGLSEKQITTMVDKYRERFKAFHSETISRTTVLESNKLGQQASWESAIEEGVVDEANLLKQWVGVKDDREREEHLAMEGETVPFSETFSNGQDYPGEDEYNCRCLALYIPGPKQDRLINRKMGAEQAAAVSERADGVIGSVRLALDTAEGATIDELVTQLKGFFPEKGEEALRSTASTQVSRLAKTTGRKIASEVVEGRGRVYRLTNETYVAKVPKTKPEGLPVLPHKSASTASGPSAKSVGYRYDTNKYGQDIEKARAYTEKTFQQNQFTKQAWASLTEKEKYLLADADISYQPEVIQPEALGWFQPASRSVSVDENIMLDAAQGRGRFHAVSVQAVMDHEVGHATDYAWTYAERRSSTMEEFWSTSQLQSAKEFREALAKDVETIAKTIRPGAGKTYVAYIEDAYGLANSQTFQAQWTRHVEMAADLIASARGVPRLRVGMFTSTELVEAFPNAMVIIRRQFARFS
jgi:hypothetical protein